MPWLMLCLLRFATDLRFVIVAALLLASILTFGSVYILAVYIPFLSVWATLESIRPDPGDLLWVGGALWR